MIIIKTGTKRHASRGAFALAMLCAASVTAFAKAPEIQEFEEVRLSGNKMIAGDATGGGAWVAENEETWKSGIITGIQVCSGAYVNRIRVFYDNKPGTEFGGPGGVCSDVWKPLRSEYIQGVRVWSGAWMNKIQFITSGQNTSPEYGGDGGALKEYYSDTGGALRVIDGKYGAYMNGIKLGFSYPYFIENFKYTGPPKNDSDQPLSEKLTQPLDNCGSATANLNSTVALGEKIIDSHTFSFGGSVTIGLSTTLEAGIPDVASVGVTSTSSLTVNLSKSDTKTTKVEFKVDAPAEAAPGTYAEVTTLVKKAKINVPFEYDVVHYEGRKSKVINRKTYSGLYTGVRALSVEPTRIEFDCQTKKPLTQAQLEAIRNPNSVKPRPVVLATPQPDYDTPTHNVEDGFDDFEDDAPSTSTNLTETLSFAMLSNNGIFERIESGVWEEISPEGNIFTYDVYDRDEDCIYLLDRDRGVVIVIDVTRNIIGFAPDKDTPPFDLYDIVDRG